LSKRDRDIVRKANIVTEHTFKLAERACARGIRVSIENPVASYMWKSKHAASVCDKFHKVTVEATEGMDEDEEREEEPKGRSPPPSSSFYSQKNNGRDRRKADHNVNEIFVSLCFDSQFKGKPVVTQRTSLMHSYLSSVKNQQDEGRGGEGWQRRAAA
jgi:hypothetical protein